MNLAFAELLGMHFGDGTLYKTTTGTVWELRGDNLEKEFYNTYVKQLIFDATGWCLEAKQRSGGKNGCYGFRCCTKEFINFFLKQNVPLGKKENIDIPTSIVFGSKNEKIAFLRGLFATDGTAYLAKINNNEQATYPMIEFANTSKILRDFVVTTLSELRIQAKSWTYNSKKENEQSTYHLRLAGKDKVKAFQEKIGLSNTKHINRLNGNF